MIVISLWQLSIPACKKIGLLFLFPSSERFPLSRCRLFPCFIKYVGPCKAVPVGSKWMCVNGTCGSAEQDMVSAKPREVSQVLFCGLEIIQDVE